MSEAVASRDKAARHPHPISATRDREAPALERGRELLWTSSQLEDRMNRLFEATAILLMTVSSPLLTWPPQH